MYGLNLNVGEFMEPALRYQAIQSGDIQITDAYSNDAELARYDLQVLRMTNKTLPTLSKGSTNERSALLKKHPELEICSTNWLVKFTREFLDEPAQLPSRKLKASQQNK